MHKDLLLHGIQVRLTINLDTLVERRPNGRREHTVTVEALGPDTKYRATYTLNASYALRGQIEKIENVTEEWARELRGRPAAEKELLALGFKDASA